MRIIIADDELHVRRRLAEKIDWRALGVDETEVCSDGDEVVEAVCARGADVLLTDIRMPRMDGIAAAREARRQCPDLAIVLMSAYDDRDYLKSALDLRAAGYLEKPFDMDEARAALEKAVGEARNKRAAGLAQRRLRRESLLAISTALLRGEETDGGAAALEAELPELFGEGRLAVLAVRLREEEDLPGHRLEPGTLRALLKRCDGELVLLGMERETAALGLAGDEAVVERRAEALFDRLEEGLAASRPSGKRSGLIAAAGGCVEGAAGLRRSWLEAQAAMERLFFHREQMAFAWRMADGGAADLTGMEQGFLLAVQNGRSEACAHYLKSLREMLLAHDDTPVREVKNLYFRLALELLDGGAGGGSEYYLWELFYRIDSLVALDGFLTELLRVRFPARWKTPTSENMEAVRGWIDAHIADPELNLDAISKAFCMSVTCLCMLFKEKTGTTVKAYVIESRMKRAAELLRMTDMKVSEVARAVGFADQGYFTKSFTKRFGASPSRYKEEKP